MSQSKDRLPPSPEEIRREAYYRWEREGRPEGRDQEHWLEAEQALVRSRWTEPGPSVRSAGALKPSASARAKPKAGPPDLAKPKRDRKASGKKAAKGRPSRSKKKPGPPRSGKKGSRNPGR